MARKAKETKGVEVGGTCPKCGASFKARMKRIVDEKAVPGLSHWEFEMLRADGGGLFDPKAAGGSAAAVDIEKLDKAAEGDLPPAGTAPKPKRKSRARKS
jgi:hypothetical protein